MDLRQLRTFHAVAELGSLSKASDRLRIAQPALSRQIKLLEHDLRTRLFVRHGRGMIQTEAGRVLFERTAGLIGHLERAREDVLAISGMPSGRVVVGLVPTISGPLAARVARRVVDSHPAIELRIVDAYGGFLVEWLHRGEINLAVVYGPAGQLHLDTASLRHEELYAVGPAGCGLRFRTSVSLEWTAGRGLVLPSPPHGLRALVDRAAAAGGWALDIRVEVDSFQALVDIVTAGVGLTFLPRYAVARQLELGLLEAAPVEPSLNRELVLAQQDPQGSSLAVRTVAAIIREEVAALGGMGSSAA